MNITQHRNKKTHNQDQDREYQEKFFKTSSKAQAYREAQNSSKEEGKLRGWPYPQIRLGGCDYCGNAIRGLHAVLPISVIHQTHILCNSRCFCSWNCAKAQAIKEKKRSVFGLIGMLSMLTTNISPPHIKTHLRDMKITLTKDHIDMKLDKRGISIIVVPPNQACEGFHYMKRTKQLVKDFERNRALDEPQLLHSFITETNQLFGNL